MLPNRKNLVYTQIYEKAEFTVWEKILYIHFANSFCDDFDFLVFESECNRIE